jgi:N-acetylglutamate synthase/N-acetylornithine aminotransferase
LAAGFKTAATSCGLKPSGNLDLGLVWSERACTA